MRLAIACLLALCAPSLATGQTSQYIFGSQSGQTIFTTEQSWIGLMPRNDVNVSAATPSTGDTYALMPTTGTFSSLCVSLTTAPGAGASWTWALYKNGLDESISVTFSGLQTQACDLVDTAGFSPGDLVAFHVTPSSSPAPASTHASWYIVQTPAVPGETILFASQGIPGTGGSLYMSLAGNSSSLGVETQMATVIPTAGTVTKFIAEAVGTGGSASATLDHNESPTTLSPSLPTPGASVEQAGNLSIAAGDVLDVFMTGYSSTTAVYASAVFVPDVAGQFVIPTWRNVLTDAVPLFYLPVSGRSDDNLQPNETLAQQIGDNLQIQAIYARTNLAPGSGTQYAFTLRDNVTNTTLSAAVSGANLTACTTSTPVTGCNSGSAVTVNDFDLLDTSVALTGSPASAVASVSYLAYVPQLAFTTEPPATGTTGTALSPVVVELQDQNGNPLSGSTASVTISSSPAGVSGTLTVNAVNGVATFSNLLFTTQGNYTLSASASGLAAVTSSSITIGAAPGSASLSSPVTFPNTPAGTTSSALVATLSNSGGGALTNIIPTITGANPSDFAISTGANACGATLAAGSSCSIYVTFTPASAASFSATLSVADSATGSPQTASLTGTGTAPAASLTASLSFPNTPDGTTSSALAATLSNTGNGALNNIVPTITGTNPSDFAISTGANACGATLAAGSSCSIYVTFTPASATTFSATLSVADSAPGSPQTAALTGTGTAPAVSLTAPLPFPNTLTGTSSAALAATLSNTGNGALNNIVPTITGTNPSDFAISTGANACGATLAAGSSCSIYVTFTPASAATFSATLSVADSATGSPQTAALTGTGTLPAASMLAFTTQPPATGTTGTTLSPVVVHVEDVNGNLVSGSSAQVTIASTPAGVSGTLTVTAVSGVVTFSNLSFAAPGSYTLSAAAAGLTGATSNSISIAAPANATFAVTGTAVSLSPGATSGDTSTINVTPAGGFTGSVTLTAAVTSSPTGAVYPPTLSFGSTSPVSITGATAGTATLTISTTAPTSSALALPRRPGVPWSAASGVAFACLLLFGIPSRRRTWWTKLGMLAFLLTLAGGVIACGGSGGSAGGGGGGGGIAGTTAGAYTVTVTGTSGNTTETGTFTLTVQ
jgi:hypothetical protein